MSALVREKHKHFPEGKISDGISLGWLTQNLVHRKVFFFWMVSCIKSSHPAERSKARFT